MSTWRHAYRVMMASGRSRDVYGQSPEGARRTAERAQRTVGYKGMDCRAVGQAVDLGHRGTDQAWCPICTRTASLFDQVPTVGTAAPTTGTPAGEIPADSGN